MLEITEAREVGVEFHSLSKTFCMPGWRVGFIVGNADIIGALARVKTNLDSGIFLPVQHAAITALKCCEDDTKRIRDVFETRRNLFVGGLKSLGWNVPLPSSTFYVWAPVPGNADSMEFTMLLLRSRYRCRPRSWIRKQWRRACQNEPDDSGSASGRSIDENQENESEIFVKEFLRVEQRIQTG